MHAYTHRAPCGAALGAFLLISTPLAHAAAPTISGTPVTRDTVGVAWSFQPTARDADGNTLTFSITNKPGFASFSNTTGRVWGTPSSEHARTWSNIVISVSDGSSRVALPAFSLVVVPNANKSPVITGTPPSTGTVGTVYNFQPSVKDPEGKAVTCASANRPAWATLTTSGSTAGRLTGKPTAAGTFSSIRIYCTDGVTTTGMPTFSITVAASGGSTNAPPVITGTPLSSVAVATAYSFRPSASDPNKDALTFSITNKPSWTTFSTTTGALTGTPTAVNVGTTSNIVISVSDGKVKTSLKAFSLAVTQIGTGAVTIDWTPPTRNSDGSVLTNLAGYRIIYGQSATALTRTVQISNPGTSSYVLENLSPGTWYFAMKSYTSSGTESVPTKAVSKTVN